MQILRSLLVPAALATAVLLPSGAFAQSAPPAAPSGQPQWSGHHHGNGMMREMRKLNLSSQQQAQIKQIVTQFRQTHPRGTEPSAQDRQQLHQQIMNVLTPAQQAQFKADMQRERQERMPSSGSTPQP